MGLHLNAVEIRTLSMVISALQSPLAEDWVVSRPALAKDLQALIGVDFIGTTRWNPAQGRFEAPFCIGRDMDMAREYEAEFQYCDPISPRIRRRRGPTLVGQVVEPTALRKMRYYNDFLRRHATTDGLDVYLFDGNTSIGDLRLWRAPGRQPLGEREVMLMQLLEPALIRAWSRPKGRSTALLGLTAREAEIAQAVASGQSDKLIANALGISIWTVRSHLTHLFEKLQVPNRTTLAAHINVQSQTGR